MTRPQLTRLYIRVLNRNNKHIKTTCDLGDVLPITLLGNCIGEVAGAFSGYKFCVILNGRLPDPLCKTVSAETIHNVRVVA